MWHTELTEDKSRYKIYVGGKYVGHILNAASAHEIVRACNSHQKLVEVAELLSWLSKCGRADVDSLETKLLEAALAEAEKKG